MRGPRSWLIKPFVYLVALAAVVLATIVLVYAVQARVRLGDLHAWHRIVLREEAGAAHPGAFESFDAYRRQEDKLFAELRERVYSDPEAGDDLTLGRCNPRSPVAQLALDTPYNRSFELAPAGEPRGARERRARALARRVLAAAQQSVLRRGTHEDRRDATARRSSALSARARACGG